MHVAEPPRARPPPPRRALSARRRRSAPLLLAVAAATLSVGALYALGMLSSISDALSRPILNDVSTDLDRPPQFLPASSVSEGAGSPGPVPLPDEFKPQIRRAYPGLKPLVVAEGSSSTKAVFAAVERLARSRAGWEVVAVVDDNETEKTLQGVATTRLLRFRDDFVFRVKASEDGRAVTVDGRSRSRLGRGDLGANAARVAGFLADLGRELGA